ncbi:hypothetical protein ACQ4PT_032614 [Festuca glaucescens]
MVEEEEASESSSSWRSYSDVVRDGSPSPLCDMVVDSAPVGASAVARPAPVRRLASVVTQPRGSASGSGWHMLGQQQKRQRFLGPLPSYNVSDGVPAELAGLCFNCGDPGHVAAVCTGKTKCLRCKGMDHVAREDIDDGWLCEASDAGNWAGGGAAADAGKGAPWGTWSSTGYSPAVGGTATPAKERLGLREPVVEQQPDGRCREELLHAAGVGAVRAVELQAARPEAERCIIYCTPEVEEAERALRWSLVAYVTGTRRLVSRGAARDAIVNRFPAVDGHISVHWF